MIGSLNLSISRPYGTHTEWVTSRRYTIVEAASFSFRRFEAQDARAAVEVEGSDVIRQRRRVLDLSQRRYRGR